MKKYVLLSLGAFFFAVVFYSFRLTQKSLPASEPPQASQTGAAPLKMPVAVNSPAAVKKSEARRSTAATQDLSNLRAFLQAADPQAQWFLTKTEQGELQSFSGGLIKEDLSTDEKALAFAQKIAELTGIEARQLSLSGKSLPETVDTRSIRIQQSYENYPVFGATLDLFLRKNDGSLYFVGSELKRLQSVETRISSTYAAAKNRVAETLVGMTFSFGEETPSPVLLALSPGAAVLCWQIEVKITKPLFEKRLLFLSSDNLQILQSRNLSIKN